MRIDIILQSNAPLPGTLARWQAVARAVPPSDACRSIANDIVRTRRLRHRHLSDFHLADPVWDMLLDLYVAEARGRQLSISDLALATMVPRSTGVRWVGSLIAEGKLQRHADSDDGRRSWVTLSDATRGALERYLHEIALLGIEQQQSNALNDREAPNMGQ